MTVAIVNHNTRAHLQACLQTVLAEKPEHVIVVDNESVDGSAKMVRRKFSQVELLEGANSGFGAGANRALRRAGTPYVLLLNSDTRLYPGTLRALSDIFDNRPHAGLIGPRLINPDCSLQPSAHPVPTPIAAMMRWTSLAHLARHIRPLRERYLLAWPHDHPKRVGWVVGAALGIRTKAFADVGGFDEDFFMYSEEVDLAYRMQQAGWEVHFTPEATVEHLGGASTAAYRDAMTVQLFLSIFQFYRKHYSCNWQRQLQMIISYFMIRNIVRDRWRLLTRNGGGGQEAVIKDIRAWQRVMHGIWREPACQG